MSEPLTAEERTTLREWFARAHADHVNPDSPLFLAERLLDEREALERARDEAKADAQRARDAMSRLREFHATPGEAHAVIAMAPEVREAWLQLLCGIIGDAPNYSEFEMRMAGSDEQAFTVLVQRRPGKTPAQKAAEHRVRAEAMAVALRDACARACATCGALIGSVSGSHSGPACERCPITTHLALAEGR